MKTSKEPANSSSSSTRKVIQFSLPDREALYAAYIPIFTEGGLFIPTADEYRLGDDVYVLLSFLDDPQRYPIVGKVVWITPPRSAGGRRQGVGIRFPKDPRSEQLRAQIERELSGKLASGRPTETI